MPGTSKQILEALPLSLFNAVMILIIGLLFVAMAVTYWQILKQRKNPDKYRTAEVFASLCAVGISTRKRPVLSMREQPMYGQLVKAFPDYVVLAQVSFSALLETNDKAVRNRYCRKYADFVICTRAFGAIAIVEYDDSSHNGREKEDAIRESFLIAAGYPVFRYRTIPDLQKLRQDITPEALKFTSPMLPASLAEQT
ncbi:DUF2726 domain-containing protein [Undibacterium sp. Tian12W]|uniref:DUF2726 domain-containing protein n=1 Tax=Undibacterium sp. Tian12W TaxID=3413054 RepID=UPI003BF3201B